MIRPVRFLVQKWRRDFLFRLYCGIFLAVTAVTALYTVYALNSLRHEAEARLEERVDRMATVLSDSLARPLFDINVAAVRSVVDALGATPEVVALRVFDTDGVLVAAWAEPPIDSSQVASTARSIEFKDGTRLTAVGRVELSMSRAALDQLLRKQIMQTVGVNLLLMLTIIGSIYMVTRTTSRPFADIQTALDQLSHGRTDIHLSGVGREDQIGQLSQAVLSFRDTITKLRQAEQSSAALLNEKIVMVDRLHAIFEGSHDAIMLLTEKGFFDCNSEALKMFGVGSKEEFVRCHPSDLSPPYQADGRDSLSAANEKIQAAMEQGQNRFEWMHRRRDGKDFPAEVLLSAFMYDGAKILQATVRDITERKLIERQILELNDDLEAKITTRTQELRHMMQAAEAANIAKSDFLANMSHEIRTPMNAIIGMAYLALQADLTPKQHDYVNKIHRAAMSLLGIINDILDFSKIEAGKLDVEAVPFSIDEVFTSVASVTSQKAADKRLEYLFRVPHTLPRNFVGDPLRLGQVLINLVNNAIKFTEAGEIEVSCARHDAGELGDGRVELRFAIRDTGIGMTPAQRAKLFQPFTQADGSTSRKYGGTGLGLSITQRLVELMGGAIDVETEAGIGTTFYFNLPLPLADLQAASAVVPAPLNDARVLVVDDSAFARQVLAESLKALPVRTEAASSAGEALRAVRAAEADGDPFKLVVTDWQMPEQDGIALIRQIKGDAALRDQPRLILTTAYDNDAMQKDALGAGASGILLKPINQTAIIDLLISVFAPQHLPMSVRTAPLRRFRDINILLAEDNDINQQIAVELLDAVGIRVDIASNGREAVDKLKQGGPESYKLVLMDLEMPEVDGHVATLEIRCDSRFDSMPIIAMTAHALPEVRERCMNEGMQDYLTKPINPEQLYAALTRWLGKPALEPLPPASNEPQAVSGAWLSCIDTTLGLSRVAGNSALYLQLLDRFRVTQRAAMERFLLPIEEERKQDVMRRAHTLRGLAGNIGATEVQDAAERLELALANDNPAGANDPDVASCLRQLQDVLSTALDELDRHFTGAEPTPAVDAPVTAAATESPDAARESLRQLCDMLADFNGDAPDFFSSVRAELNTLLDIATLDRVAAHMREYEFEDARGVLMSGVEAADVK
ncbi:hypothetical protein BH11PSE11_BH11PSE11_37910 [soil metagenome]